MKLIRTASVFAISALLVACGGGGGGPTPPATATLVTGSGVIISIATSFNRIKYPLSDVIAPTPFVNPQQAGSFSAVNSVSDFEFSDGLGSKFKFNATGVSLNETRTDTTISSIGVLGGAIWSQAQFGFLSYNFNQIDTEGTTYLGSHYVPFFIANKYSPQALSDATYATSGSAVGVGTSDFGSYLRCGVSATYTKSSQELVLTLADCFPGDPPGTVEGTIELRPTGSRATGFRRYFYGRGIEPSAATYAFGGLEGQELVGAVRVGDGVTSLSIVFGAKK